MSFDNWFGGKLGLLVKGVWRRWCGKDCLDGSWVVNGGYSSKEGTVRRRVEVLGCGTFHRNFRTHFAYSALL